MKKATRPIKRPRVVARRYDVDEFDEEFISDTFAKPPAPALRKWQRAVKGVGRPVRGAGAKVISVSVERTLLAKTDAMARELGISRAELIARGLRAALAAAGAT